MGDRGKVQFHTMLGYQTESEACQQKEGDCLMLGYQSNHQELTYFQAMVNSTDKLLECFKMLCEADKQKFKRKYGNLAALLEVPVQKPAIKALAQLWDPSYRCFSFGGVDLTLTIEEYQQFLCIPNHQYHVYLYRRPEGVVDRIEEWMNAKMDRGLARGTSDSLHWDAWYQLYLQKLRDPQASSKRLKILALGIYGLVLFPSRTGMISFDATNVYIEMEKKQINPIAAILAETILSLNHCRRVGKGTMRCCVQLLFVWAVSHVEAYKSIFRSSWWINQEPLKEFAAATWRNKSEQEWTSLFLELSTTSFPWKAVWMNQAPYLAYCGTRPWVPLIGSTGYTSYAPTMVSRQLGYEQCVPRTVGLREFEGILKNDTSSEFFSRIKNDWSLYGMVGQRIMEKEFATTKKYVLWQAIRGRDCKHSAVPFQAKGTSVSNPLVSKSVTVQSISRHTSESQADNMVLNQSKKRKADDDAEKASFEKDALMKDLEQIKLEKQMILDDLLDERKKRMQADSRVQDLEEEVQLWQSIVSEEENWEALCHRAQTELACKITEVNDIQLQNQHISSELNMCQTEIDGLQTEKDKLEAALNKAFHELDRYKKHLFDAEKGIAVLEKEKKALVEDQQRQSVYWASTNDYLATVGKRSVDRIKQLETQIEVVRQKAISIRNLHRRILNRESNYGANAFMDYLARCEDLLIEIARYGRVFGA